MTNLRCQSMLNSIDYRAAFEERVPGDAAGLLTRAAGLLIAGTKGVPPDSHYDRPGSPGCHLRDPWRIRFGPTWDYVAGGLFPSADNSNSVGGNPDGALTRFDVYTAAIIVPMTGARIQA